MRNIEDLEHFVLAEGETLILRPTIHLSMEQLSRLRETVEKFLPGRPVLVLTPELEIMAGHLEVMGVDTDVVPGPTAEELAAARNEIMDAYNSGRIVYVIISDREWWYVHNVQNPHTFDWDRYTYSLTKPKTNN